MKNLTIVSLSENYGKEVAQQYSKKLNFYFADAKGILTYNFIDEDAIKMCGVDYFLEIKESSIQQMAQYENAVTFMSAEMFLSIANKEKYLESSPLVYLYLSMDKFMLSLYNDKKMTQSEREVNILQYDDRDRLLRSYAKYIIPNKTLGIKSALKALVENIKIGE